MNYITILNFMVEDLGLKGNELIVFALIYGFCQDGVSKFYGSYKYIQERTGISNYTVNECLKKLVEKKYLIKSKENVNGVNICSYSLSEEISFSNEKTSLSKMRKPHFGNEESSFRGNEESSHNNKIYINKRENKEYIENCITEIIKYLNKKTNKAFRTEVKNNRTFIRARLEDGYKVKDFKHVIDVKVDEWLNTDMETYLNPQTLFRPSNFEKYLNQKRKVNKEKEEETTW